MNFFPFKKAGVHVNKDFSLITIRRGLIHYIKATILTPVAHIHIRSSTGSWLGYVDDLPLHDNHFQ
jgi:hypothetical protein